MFNFNSEEIFIMSLGLFSVVFSTILVLPVLPKFIKIMKAKKQLHETTQTQS